MNFILTGLRPCSVTPRQSSCELKPEIAQFITLRKLGRVGEVTQQAGGMARGQELKIYEKKGQYWGKNQFSLSSSTLAHSTEKSQLHTTTLQGRSFGPQLPASPPPQPRALTMRKSHALHSFSNSHVHQQQQTRMEKYRGYWLEFSTIKHELKQ